MHLEIHAKHKTEKRVAVAVLLLTEVQRSGTTYKGQPVEASIVMTQGDIVTIPDAGELVPQRMLVKGWAISTREECRQIILGE